MEVIHCMWWCCVVDSVCLGIETSVKEHRLHVTFRQPDVSGGLSVVSVRSTKSISRTQSILTHIPLCGLYCHRGECVGAACKQHEQSGWPCSPAAHMQ
jgi:hypothetical protein